MSILYLPTKFEGNRIKITQKLRVSLIFMFDITLTLTFSLATLGPEFKLVLSSYIKWPRIIEIESKVKKKKINQKIRLFVIVRHDDVISKK